MATKFQDAALRAHFRAFGIDRSSWLKMRTALKLVEEYAPAIERAAIETAFPNQFAVTTVRRVFDVLANGPRGEFRGKA